MAISIQEVRPDETIAVPVGTISLVSELLRRQRDEKVRELRDIADALNGLQAAVDVHNGAPLTPPQDTFKPASSRSPGRRDRTSAAGS